MEDVSRLIKDSTSGEQFESSRLSSSVSRCLPEPGSTTKNYLKGSIHILPGKHRFSIILIRYQRSNKVAASFEYSSPPCDKDMLKLLREKVVHRDSIARALKKWRRFRRQSLATIIESRRKEQQFISRADLTACLGRINAAVRQFQDEDPKFRFGENRELVEEIRNASWDVHSMISSRLGWSCPYGIDDVRRALDEIHTALVFLHHHDRRGKAPGNKQLAVHIWSKWDEIHAIIGNPPNWGVTQKFAKEEFAKIIKESKASSAIS